MKETATAIGRLTTFGVDKDAPWQALLISPNRYLDLRYVVRNSHELSVNEEGIHTVIEGIVLKAATYDPIKKRASMTLVLADRRAQIHIYAHGHPNQFPGDWRRANSHVALIGNLIVKPDGFCLIFDPTPIAPSLIGGAMGVYPSRSGVIGADTVRERVLGLLTDENLSLAATHLRERLGKAEEMAALLAWGEHRGVDHMDKTTLERVIYRMHAPTSPEQGQAAINLLTDLDAFCTLQAVEAERPTSGIFQQVVVDATAINARIETMTHSPTDEQHQAVWDFLGDMAKGKPAHRLLSGDVGTGKSTVILLLMAAVYDAGGTVAIMLPSAEMVDQMAREAGEWWPDIPLEKVTAQTRDEALSGRVRLGTTALIHRCADWKPTLTIVDEQQRMSVNQRHALTHNVGHLLESTATCLPRTLAQVMFGLVPVSRLTRPHTPKYIHTHIHDIKDPDAKRALFKDIQATLDAGDQVLVIYAARDRSEADKIHQADVDALKKENAKKSSQGQLNISEERTPPKVVSLEEGLELWQGVFGEDAIASLHGKMKAKDRQKALDAMLSGRARILCATTAAEVGLNIPLLRRTVIQNPERLGITQLHQIRGRVARKGGDGWCDLLADINALREASMERLQALCSTQDGFKLAELDMRQRGLGDLSAKVNRQSGTLDAGFLRNSKLNVEHFEAAAKMQRVMERSG